MPSSQTLLFANPRPLVERLGREFFRQLPEGPGVYLMRDAADTVLYVGKAKNLRRRLGSYRVANPDRLRRRHLRLLRAVMRIEVEECPDELSALTRESELLRSLKPKFNRAGTWPAPPHFLAWRWDGEQIELAVLESPDPQWNLHGVSRSRAAALRTILVRLLWFALYPELGIAGMPSGWVHGKLARAVIIACGARAGEVSRSLHRLLSGEPEAFCGSIRAKMGNHTPPFEKTVVENDLEYLSELFSSEP